MRNISNKPKDNSSRLYSFFEGGTIAPVAGVVDIVVEPVNENHVYVGTLVAATTINLPNAQKAKLVKGDKVLMVIPSDATGRTITWGTNIKSSAATLAIAASGKTFVQGVYDGTDLVIR